ncbi:hypothetical protein [Sphingomonas cavernae]|uniref:Uncharacterized protein n=1 Tax=Sphingomonas cavernae TaxID=2320861 RepID=A0A418W703_9SPHN|nr:hypothetical protein [Sphingomonas cavernae]RJF85823.1 hypothetical protein D3876_18285 [Sphingomonas cavernae]
MTDGSSNAEDTNTDRRDADAGKRGRWGAAGLGAAIGSAAIVAALLYVKSSKEKNKDKRES